MNGQPNQPGSEEPTEAFDGVEKPSPQDTGGSLDETIVSSVNKAVDEALDAPSLEFSAGNPDEQVTGFGDQRFDSRYEIQGEIARGGMGAVMRGRDRVLQRELAIKVLLAEKHKHATALQRFVEEAQIAGQLQHPGIVPVYDLGQMSDESPFFAMKLVEGQTLSSLLENRASPQEDLPKFLVIFEQICQAIAFAHSRKVIHRDLKPSNVMVGGFGEVQVMDWGLAKVLTETTANESEQQDTAELDNVEATVQSLRTQIQDDTNVSQTRYGSVMGTLGYMPPEQATGKIDLVDTRADVFALGAILCQTLTGDRPYIASSRNDILLMSIQGDLQPCFGRLRSCGADDELVELAIDCLEPSVDQRPPDAGVVAQRMTSHLESVSERLRSAEIERASSEARAEEATKTAAAERKKRQLAAGLAALGVLLCATLGLGGFIVQKNRAALQAAKVQRKQELHDQHRREEQLLENELVVAESLVKRIEKSDIPKVADIKQLVDASARVQENLTSSLQGGTLDGRVKAVSQSSSELRELFQLVTKLDLIQVESSKASLRRSVRTISNAHGKQRDVDEYSAAHQISTVLQEWISNDDENPIALAQRIRSAPKWARPTIINALYHWHHEQLDESDFQRTRNAEANYLKLVESTSTGSATLKQLPDSSILVEGANRINQSHEMIFDLGPNPVSVIQLQALSHTSLPSNGPGRDPDGKGVFANLNFHLSTSENSNAFQPLKFVGSEANYSNPSAKFSGKYWSLAGGAGKDHYANFYLEQPITARSRAKLRVTFNGNAHQKWGNGNIGCFRLAALDIPTTEKHQARTNWIASLLGDVDQNDWRKAHWNAIRHNNVESLLQLADDEKIEEQSANDVIRLSESLFLLGESHAVTQFSDQVQWNPFVDPQLSGDPLQLQADGSVFNPEEKKTASDHTLAIELDRQRVTAVRFETFSDARLPDGGPERHRAGEGCAVRGISLMASKTPDADPRKIRVLSTTSDHKQFFDHNLSFLIDDDEMSFWRCDHPQDTAVCSCVFVIHPDDAEGDWSNLIANIKMGLGGGSGVGRFRFSWTSDPIPKLKDGRQVAENLLSKLLLRDPRSYRTLIARAQIAASTAPPDMALAQQCATAAMSLRPEDVQTAQTFARLLLSDEPEGDSEVLQHLRYLSQVREEKYGDRSVLDAVLDQQRNLGDLYTYSRQRPRGITAFENLRKFDPDRFDRHHRLGLLYGLEGRTLESIELLEEARRREPKDEWIAVDLAERYISVGRYQQAVDLMESVSDTEVPAITLAIAYAGSKNNAKAIEAWETYAKSEEMLQQVAWEQRITMAHVYAELGRIDEAYAILDQILAKSKTNTSALLARAAVVQLTDGEEKTREFFTNERKNFRFVLDAVSIEIIRQTLLPHRMPSRFWSKQTLLNVTRAMRSIDRKREQILNAQSILLVQLGRGEEAIEAIDKTMPLDKRGAMEWLIIAMAQESIGQDKLAMKSLQSADQLRPQLQSSLHEVFDSHRSRIER